jgi:hypothetical protein
MAVKNPTTITNAGNSSKSSTLFDYPTRPQLSPVAAF